MTLCGLLANFGLLGQGITVHVDIGFEFGERNRIEDVTIVYQNFAVEVCVMKTIAISHCNSVQIQDNVVVYEASDVGINCKSPCYEN